MTEINKIEKDLPVISFTSSKDSKKYRDKKRKERKVKKEKGIKVNKIQKQVYNSDSEGDDEDDDDEDNSEIEDEEEEQTTTVKKQKTTTTTTTTSKTNEPTTRYEQDKEALSNKLGNILAVGTSTRKNKIKEQTTTTKKAAAPILLKTEQTLNENIKKEKEKKKAEKDKQLEKELLETKDYKPIEILLTPEERDLMRLAKKGVIKLFNAVTQHQQSGMTASVDSKSKNITKNQFLENIKNSKVKKANKDDDDDDEYSDDDYSDDQNEQGGDFLKDDYLVKNEYDIKEEQD